LANNQPNHFVLNDLINANVQVQTSFFSALSSTFDTFLSSASKTPVLQAIPTRHSAEQMFGSRAQCAFVASHRLYIRRQRQRDIPNETAPEIGPDGRRGSGTEQTQRLSAI
jgi:hypothetical protein